MDNIFSYINFLGNIQIQTINLFVFLFGFSYGAIKAYQKGNFSTPLSNIFECCVYGSLCIIGYNFVYGILCLIGSNFVYDFIPNPYNFIVSFTLIGGIYVYVNKIFTRTIFEN